MEERNTENQDLTATPTSSASRDDRQVDQKIYRMGHSSIPRLIIEFSIPSIVGMLVNGSYNLLASAFLGQAMGAVGLSVMTVATPIMILFMAFSMLVGAGGNALAALRLGQGRPDEAERSLGNTVTLSIFLSAFVAVFVSIPPALDWLLTISSVTDSIRDLAGLYVRIISYGLIFQCIGAGVNNFIRTAGAPNRALLTMVIGAASCTVFNYFLVLVLGLGVFGCGIATIGGQALSCFTVLWYFRANGKAPFRLRAERMRPHREVIAAILKLGTASFFIQIGSMAFNLVFNYQLAYYGALNPLGVEAALASIGVVQRVAMFTVLPLVGVAMAIQPLLGYNYGAHKYDRVKKTLWIGVFGATLIAVFMWAMIHLFPQQIVGAFGLTDGALVGFTVYALKVQMLLLPFVGFQIVCSNYFQATGQPAKSIFLSLSRQVLFLIPLAFLLPAVLPGFFPQLTGLDALYWAVPCADFLAIFSTLVFIIWEMRRLRRLERGEITARF
ncbi:MAG: MATE family efflux transporter [Eggerthellaceae bacterium]|jgi:putative MATE family efflux protein